MNSLEMIDKKEQLKVKLNSMLDVAEQEQRKLTDSEMQEFEAINKEITDLDNEIRSIKEETKQVKTMKNFSLLKLLLEFLQR